MSEIRFDILHYILVDRQPVCVEDVVKWGRWFEQATKDGQRIVAKDKIFKHEVSTVFLGLDHNFTGHGPPILFETMVFVDLDKPKIYVIEDTVYRFVREELNGFTMRYATWDEAEAGHRDILNAIRRIYIKQVGVNGI